MSSVLTFSEVFAAAAGECEAGKRDSVFGCEREEVASRSTKRQRFIYSHSTKHGHCIAYNIRPSQLSIIHSCNGLLVSSLKLFTPASPTTPDNNEAYHLPMVLFELPIQASFLPAVDVSKRCFPVRGGTLQEYSSSASVYTRVHRRSCSSGKSKHTILGLLDGDLLRSRYFFELREYIR